jgi:hypothetical protein
MKIIKSIIFTPKKISSLLAIFIACFALTAIIFVSSFLYKNFYKTPLDKILELGDKVILDKINMKKFDSIMDKLATKTTASELKNITSPFR